MNNRLLLSFIFAFCFCAGLLQAQTQHTNLPSVYINTENNAGVYSKTTYVNSEMLYVDTDSVAVYDNVGIRGRGNSTWGLAKKPYRLKFAESTKLLGKGYAKSKSWVLLANHADKSLIRNAVTFEMGDFMGLPFNPAVRFVDFTLNGSFLGNYQLTDQVKVDNHRVEVMEQDYPLADTSNITGGYLVEVDGFGTSEVVYFRTNKNIVISVKYPDEDEIDVSQTNYIKNHFQEFENALFSDNFTDPVAGYRAYVDSATLINWYLATELSANVDGFWSTFVYKEQNNPKLFFGPLWDYDIAYNNCNRVGDVTNRTMTDAGFGSNLTKVWVLQMIKDNWFNKAVNNRWKYLVSNGLEEHLLSYIDSLADNLQSSQTLNYQVWSISAHVYNEIYLYSTYQEYINQLKSFITDHIAYLSTAFASRVKDDPDPDPEPDPTGDSFTTNGNFYYLVTNRGCGNALDVTGQSTEPGGLIELYTTTYDRFTQHWHVVPLSDTIFQLLNRESGLALNDPTQTPKATGAQLNLAEPDKNDTRQQWRIVVANEDGYYNFINCFSDNAINNSGGGTANGSRVVSYTNDARNAVSNNRQWTLEAQERVPEYQPDDTVPGLSVLSDSWAQLDVTGDPVGDEVYIPDDIVLPSFDYSVVYNPDEQTIRFASDNMEALQKVQAVLYDVSGRQLLGFTADNPQSIEHLPGGIYLLRWSVDGVTKSVKLMKK